MVIEKSQHKSNLLQFSLSIVLFVAVVISCRTTNSNEVEFEDGISLQIKELLGDELLAVIENDLEVPIHRGENPPNVKAILDPSNSSTVGITVIMEPTVLVRTNIPGEADNPGQLFDDTFFRFENQDNENYTIDFYRTNLGEEPYVGRGSFIIGDGTKFTVIGLREDIVEKDTARSVSYFSGVVEDEGISSGIGGILMIENNDAGSFIPNGTGRSFKDDDGFLPLDDWPFPSPLKSKNGPILNRQSGFDTKLMK